MKGALSRQLPLMVLLAGLLGACATTSEDLRSSRPPTGEELSGTWEGLYAASTGSGSKFRFRMLLTFYPTTSTYGSYLAELQPFYAGGTGHTWRGGYQVSGSEIIVDGGRLKLKLHLYGNNELRGIYELNHTYISETNRITLKKME